MNNERRIKISKFLIFLLRHDVDTLGASTENGGWVKVDDLMARAQLEFPDFTKTILFEIVETDQKQRFAILDKKIRAQQGHSVNVGSVGHSTKPPDVLFHGTTTENWSAIQSVGAILRMSRQHVHLSPDHKTAWQVASRRRTPNKIILEIAAKEMFDAGHNFELAGNGVWLTETVPARFVSVRKRN